VTDAGEFRFAAVEFGRPPTGVEDMADEKNVRRAAVAAAGGGLLLFVIWYVWWSRPPQLGGDKESLKVVEALYTAVGSRNTERLAHCEGQLHTLRDEGKLPRRAADYLDGLIKTARGGNWQGATHKLFDFLRAQRRNSA
jgi:hypothetical protein